MKQKSRFDGLDVAAMTAHVRRNLLGHKLANVYDGVALASSLSSDSSARGTFVFKLANPSANSNNASSIDKAAKTATPSTSSNDGGAAGGDTEPVSNRAMLLMESGVRFHITSFYATGDAAGSASTPPSNFAMKLRKHLRNLRLENVTQLGNLDRVVDFRFGSGELAHHLLLELYGLGNLILTNGQYEILALLRVHEYSLKKEGDTVNGASASAGAGNDLQEQVKVRVGNVYPVTYATTIASPIQTEPTLKSEEDLLLGELEQDENNKSTTTQPQPSTLLAMNGEQAYAWAKVELKNLADQALASKNNPPPQTSKRKKKEKKDGSTTLKMLLLKPASGVFHYGPALIEHCILHAAILGPSAKFTLETSESLMPPSHWTKLLQSLREEGKSVLDKFHSGEGGGFILYRPKDAKSETTNDNKDHDEFVSKVPHSDKILEEFQPHLLLQHKDRPQLPYNSFSNAVDEFFSLLEGQKRALRAEGVEKAANERLEKIKRDQATRMERLELDMVQVKDHAQLVELHADDVDKALGVINSALDGGMDWETLEELVAVEQANENPIALLINRLLLDNDSIELSLPDTMVWDPNSREAPPIVKVKVSLLDSAHGNARSMYNQYRTSKDKANKTHEASETVLKAAEANALKQIEQARNNKKMTFSVMMQPQRKQHWFEKFNWFITSDNYLVVGGRDAQQNEILVKRYLRPGDAYIHADVHGAPTCILRAKRRRTANKKTEVLPLSDQALIQAGNFAICRSSAWPSRMVTSAWWVDSHQVSKTAPTGEYLTVGSFMIRGKKNFLPATQLEMGLGIVFRLGDDASVARHINDRRDFALLTMDDTKDDFISAGDALVKTQSPVTTKEVKEEKKLVSKSVEENNLSSPRIEGGVTVEDGKHIGEVKHGKDSTADQQEEDVKKKKKGLSIKEKKLIKKYGSLQAANDALAEVRLLEEKRKAEKEEKIRSSELETETQIKTRSSTVRGKKLTKKKMRKYADQDDEDKELAILALQGGEKIKGGKKKGGSAADVIKSDSQMKAAAETTALLVRDPKEFIYKLPEEVVDLLSKCVGKNIEDDSVRWNKLDAEVLEQLIAFESDDAKIAAANRLFQLSSTSRIDNFSASLAGIIRTIRKYGFEGIQLSEGAEINGEGKQRKTKAEKEAEREAWRGILAEDGIIEEEGESNGAVDDTAEIGKLTGKPLSEDLLLYALPVCAPYQTLSQYKYRVKLTPGNQKRGKASKQCLEMFLRMDDQQKSNKSSSRIIDLMKSVNDNEWVQAICGDVKISTAGASKIIKKQKAKAKKGKKK